MGNIKQFILKLPLVKPLLMLVIKRDRFKGSAEYWERRYLQGGTSGSGSYNRLGEFKAEIINDFVAANNVNSVIEFGCGDGNQLVLAKYPNFIGLDVSQKALLICIDRFSNDKTKSFFMYDSLAFRDNFNLFKIDLALSLDVIYHLVEDAIFEKYMFDLFNSATKYVIIYSSNFNKKFTYYETDRDFTTWVAQNINGWKFVKKIDNRYPQDFKDDENTSRADFYFYEKL